MSLASDLKRLAALAYHRRERCGALVERYHALKAAKSGTDLRPFKSLYAWLFVPLTLWPIEVDALLKMVLAHAERKQPLTLDILLLMNMLPPLPDGATQAILTAHEHEVAAGRYESSINAHHKFDATENELCDDPQFAAQWLEITRRFDPRKYADHKGVIRRRMVSERNFRENWVFRWTTARDRFQEIFDAFCQRWHLYGMQDDRPLLLKLSINLTPYGTMVFIPGFWSFDWKRDIRWQAVKRLHRAHGATKQGPKSTQNRLAQKKEIQLAKRLWSAAGKANLKGKARYDFVKKQLKWDPRTDDRKVRRLVNSPATPP